MFKKILVPLDGSALSSAVLPILYPIARCAHADVVLLRVVPEIGMRIGASISQSNEQLPESLDSVLDIAREYLSHVAAEFTKQSIETQVRVTTGSVVEGILDVANEESVDLIAMSTHGRGGLGRFLLGSVAGQVVHYAKVPVLLMRVTGEAHQPAERIYQKILVPLDGSDFSRAVLPHASEIARCFGARVILLQAIPEPEPTAGEVNWMFTLGGIAAADTDTRRQLVESARAELVRRAELEMEAAQSNLNDATSVFKSAGLTVETVVQMGRPAEVILDVAAASGVDMIAMATHGRSGIQRLLLGSVADRIVRHAHVPVLLVRPESSNA